MKKIKPIINLGIAMVLLAAIVFLSQLWFDFFSDMTFSKIMTTLGIIGGTLFLGGILYYEYSTDKIDQDKNLLS